MAKNDIHVVHAGDQGLDGRDCRRWRTPSFQQGEAITEGLRRALEDKVELVIHGRDGPSGERNSFGYDTNSIPG